MKTAIYKSIFGDFCIGYENDVVLFLKKLHERPTSKNEKNSFTDGVFSQIEEYFNGKRKSFSFKYELIGTNFQKKVWNELCNIPYGKTCTYKDIAIAIGNEKACRAVGNANNKNPISIAVPCHRVIGASGKLVGYAGGLDMKECLLKIESENK